MSALADVALIDNRREIAVRAAILAVLRNRHPEHSEDVLEECWRVYRSGNPAMLFALEEAEIAANAALDAALLQKDVGK